MSPILTKVVQEVQELDDAERQQLRNWLEKTAAPATDLSEPEKLRKQLVVEGVLSHVPKQKKDLDRFLRWQPIRITGKPLSETIIEERR